MSEIFKYTKEMETELLDLLFRIISWNGVRINPSLPEEGLGYRYDFTVECVTCGIEWQKYIYKFYNLKYSSL